MLPEDILRAVLASDTDNKGQNEHQDLRKVNKLQLLVKDAPRVPEVGPVAIGTLAVARFI